MLKCAIFCRFLRFENGCCYLSTIAHNCTQDKKNTCVSCIPYLIGLNTSLSYIRMVIGEILCLNVPFLQIS